MLVAFDNLVDFIAELRAERSSHNGGPLVRITSELQQAAIDGSSRDQHVFLIAGFKVDGELRELKHFCGENLAGGKNEGSTALKAAIDKLIGVCKDMKVECRGGFYKG